MDFTPRDIQSKFKEIFGAEPLIIRAPGRINLIGEHTDYNDGFVMPAAVDKEIFFGIGPSNGRRSVIHALQYNEKFEPDLHEPKPVDKPGWANYLLGIVHQFREKGHPLKHFNCVFGGNIPTGAGMASSAALASGFAFALAELHLLNIPKLEIISMAQWTEHHYVGVKCGIMDQFASVMGKKDNVIVLDCRSLSHRYAPLDLREYGIVLCDTKVKHSLVASEYNVRRQECETGVRTLQQHYPQIQSLRDVSMDMLEKHRREFQGKIYQRCSYVVQEILRVQQACADLERGDVSSFGKKMLATHEGLSSLYEVSCEELDFLVSAAREHEGVLGARMMGGGFGGCTINLVKNDLVGPFIQKMTVQYKESFGVDMPAYPVRIVDGTGRVPESELSLWT